MLCSKGTNSDSGEDFQLKKEKKKKNITYVV